MDIKYIARNKDGKKIEAVTLLGCINGVMIETRWQKFTIAEYRNGEHRLIIGGDGSYFRRKYESRAEAKSHGDELFRKLHY